MDAPFLYKGDESIKFSLRQVVELVDNLESLSALKQIIEASDHQDLYVDVPADVVNFLKMEMFKAGLHKKSDYARKQIASGYTLGTENGSVVQCAHMPVKPG